MAGHFGRKYRCLIEKNITTQIFSPVDGSSFLRAMVEECTGEYPNSQNYLSFPVQWYAMILVLNGHKSGLY